MEIVGLIQDNWVALSTSIGGISAWIYERKKRIIESKNSELNHSKSIIDMYEDALDDLPEHFEKRETYWKNRYKDLKQELENCKKSIK
ncbi:hypothetical protein OAE03_01510 [Winogradskyella sp.]|nr:hypothetical protein [Winogradskyella sp.]MDC0009215.1 hypothetical protein [Winogradskyella sp.]